MTGLNVYYYVKPGMLEAFIDELCKNQIAEKCRNEDGCLQYDYFLPLENSSNILLLTESWATPEAQKKHTTQPHFILLQELKAKYVSETKFQNFSKYE